MGRPSTTASDSGGAAGQTVERTGTRKRPANQDDPMLGRVLDARYRIEQVLGTGGVGVVYRAVHTGLHHAVALKVLRHGYEDIEMLRRRFQREAKVMSQLNHPNIVGLTDYGIADNVPYLVMELLEGRSLDELLDDEGPPDPRATVEITRAVVRGLAFAHARGVLHRDLKPGNVFLQQLPDDPHHVKLLDFGLAKILDDGLDDGSNEPTITKAGTVIGTPAYMAPEQGAGQRVDARADVYSAGVLLFELLSGDPPFEADRRADLLRAHMVSPVPDPAAMRPGLIMSRELQALLLKALAKEPADRFQNAAEMLDALDALPDPPASLETAESEPTHSSRAPTLRDALEPDRRKPARPKLWAVAALVVAALGALVWLVARGLTTESAPEPTVEQPPPVLEVPEVVVEATETPELEPEATPTRTNPFEEPLPEELATLAERIRSSDELDREAHQDMRIYQRLHPEDPRPSLLLAHDFVDRGAWTQALERYELAQNRSPDARRDPRMLEDFIRAAQVERLYDDASERIGRIFGADAIPAVREARARTEDRPKRRLLARLLSDLG